MELLLVTQDQLEKMAKEVDMDFEKFNLLFEECFNRKSNEKFVFQIKATNEDDCIQVYNYNIFMNEKVFTDISR